MTQDNTVLRQAINEITLEGLLLEIESREGKTSDGKEYLQATLTIETGENEQHDVEMFTMKHKKDSNEVSGIYESLRTVVDEYKSVDKVGREEADYVRVAPGSEKFSNGQLARNDYVGSDGQLRSFPQLTTTFVNRVEGEPNPHAKFETELVVESVTEEIGKNEEETGRAVLKGYIPVYGGKVIPFEFVVNEDGASYVLDNYEKGDTVFVYGDIVNKRIKNVRKIEGAFGSDNEKVTYTYVREFVVIGGSAPYDDDDPKTFNTEAIGKALAEREVYLEELIEKSKKKDNKKKGGFDTTKKSKKRDVKEEDLPF